MNSMKTLILNGSPRENGDTASLIREAIRTPGNGKNICSAYSWFSLTIALFHCDMEEMRLSAKISDTHLDA